MIVRLVVLMTMTMTFSAKAAADEPYPCSQFAVDAERLQQRERFDPKADSMAVTAFALIDGFYQGADAAFEPKKWMSQEDFTKRTLMACAVNPGADALKTIWDVSRKTIQSAK